jgi:hypothetical protein
LTESLQSNLSVASRNVVDLTGHLDSVVRRDSGQIDTLLSQLNRTAHSFGETMDSLHDVATDPKVKRQLTDTARDLALSAHTVAALTQDLRSVTSDPQTQAHLRDTIAQLDATAQKVDSLVGQIGGTSSVYGVDHGATPPPAPVPAPSGDLLLPAQPAPSGGATATPGNQSSGGGSSAHGTSVAALRERIKGFTKDLVQLQVRVSELAPLRPGSFDGRNVSPLLTQDRGPLSDFNAFILPYGRTGLEAGVNDIGTPYGTTTGNLMLLNRSGGFTYGGGVEYSRLGLTTSIAGRALGFEARAYDLRHPTLDTYLNVLSFKKFQIFGGERDVTHASRRTTFGLQFEF